MSDAQMGRVLAIETSCDDTSVAVVADQARVESVCSANQDLAHAPFGGVVPELASRNHSLNILPLVEEAFRKAGCGWEEIDGLAVTSRPGLVGALMVGVVTAKTLALAFQRPLIGVNHIEGHLLAPWLRDDGHQPPLGFAFPYLALAISGGHSHLFLVRDVGEYHLLGQTLDDAAGEAFDKFAKMVGLGYPGGPRVDQHAKNGNPKSFSFPRALLKDEHLNFSFSGLKTSAHNLITNMTDDERRSRLADLCASYQEAVVDALLAKFERAVEKTGVTSVALTGGVSANSRLRERAQNLAQTKGWTLAIPPLRYCTDNAAMIGWAGLARLKRGERSGQDLGPSPAALPNDYRWDPL